MSLTLADRPTHTNRAPSAFTSAVPTVTSVIATLFAEQLIDDMLRTMTIRWTLREHLAEHHPVVSPLILHGGGRLSYELYAERSDLGLHVLVGIMPGSDTTDVPHRLASYRDAILKALIEKLPKTGLLVDIQNDFDITVDGTLHLLITN